MSRRIRSIKPEWLEDERLAQSSDTARMVSVALITMADDYGNGRANEMFLAAQIWPYSRDAQETLMRLSRAADELSQAGFVAFYTVKGQRYFSITNWAKHQKVQHPGKPIVPGPEQDDSEAPRAAVTDVSGDSHEVLTPEGKGREGIGGRSRAPASPPDRKVQPEDVSGAWHAAMHGPDGNPTALHATGSWREEYDAIADVLNLLAGDERTIAMRALCEWFWRGETGPVADKRIERRKANPGHLAKHVSTDLDAAKAWWLARKTGAAA